MPQHFHACTLQVWPVHSPVSRGFQAAEHTSAQHLHNICTAGSHHQSRHCRGVTELTANAVGKLCRAGKSDVSHCATKPSQAEEQARDRAGTSMRLCPAGECCSKALGNAEQSIAAAGGAQLRAWRELSCSGRAPAAQAVLGWLRSASHTCSRSPLGGKAQKRKKSQSLK